MKTKSGVIAVLIALGLMVRAVSAQDAFTVEFPPGVELPPGIVLPPGVNRPGSAKPGGTNASAKAESPEDKRLQELLKLKFDRSATSIISGLVAQFDPENVSTNEVERFKQRVVAGDWKSVGEFLAGLPKDHGKQVHRYIVKELQATRQPGQPNPQMPEGMMMGDQPMMINQGQQGPATSATLPLVMDDIITLAEIAPYEITEADAKSLGQLLGKLLSRGDALEPLIVKLESGVKNLGGSKPEDRRRAAELLLGANRLTEAARFLAPVELAKEKLDWTALEQHARELATRGQREKDSKLMVQAWELNQFILNLTNTAATNRDSALRRCMDLLPQLSRETGTNWLRLRFMAEPAQGLGVFSVVNQLVQKGFTDRNVESRKKNLELQKQAVEIFLGVADPAQPYWRAALNLLAQGWLQEASWAKLRYRLQQNMGQQFDQFGNMIGYEGYPQPYFDGNQIPPLTPEQILPTAPAEAWLTQLDGGLKPAVLAVIADLHSKTETPDKALPFIEAVAATQTRGANDLANAFLRAWAQARNPNRNQMNQGRYYVNGVMYYGGYNPYGMQQQAGIPLTRAMQVRNIKELSGILRRLEALKLTKLEDDALVAAFSAAHSPAEVFLVEDMEAVFGPREKVKPDTLAGLAQTMRERLAQQWRTPRTQQEAKTQRNDKQIDAEVMRGYDLVLKLIDEALQRDSDNWQLNLARASTWFDLAEFQYGKKVDLAIYVEKREEAFKGFARSAFLYAAALPRMEEKEETPRVFQSWFNATLGASDLAYVTRQQEPETNQLARVRDAMNSLPGGAGARHLAAFAKQLGQNANTLKPELKPRYLRAGLSITGNHPDAQDARKLVAYYDDLLNELELVVRPDGDVVVGHSKPFGVFVSLRHTADIEREANGFGRYLRNTKNASSSFYGGFYGMGQQRNFVDEFEKQVREKLADHFDVKSVTFVDEKVKSRGYGRTGWRETPLAYLLLQAKDGSVDQIPTFHMDLDFSDSRGQVVLPVESQVTLIDSRPDRAPSRPMDKLEITQTLDDRELAKGIVNLEIKATARGIVSDFTELLRTNFNGLTLGETGDRGLAVTQIDTEGDNAAPVSERNWLLKFTVAENAPPSLEFKFPEPVNSEAKMVYKRYADADLVEVKPSLALAGVSLRPRPWWHWVVGSLVIVGVALLGFWWLRRTVVEERAELPTYALPKQVTPFAVIQLLRRMETDGAFRSNQSHVAELTQEIRQMETHFFDRQRNGNGELNLVDIGRRWVERAN